MSPRRPRVPRVDPTLPPPEPSDVAAPAPAEPGPTRSETSAAPVPEAAATGSSDVAAPAVDAPGRTPGGTPNPAPDAGPDPAPAPTPGAGPQPAPKAAPHDGTELQLVQPAPEESAAPAGQGLAALRGRLTRGGRSASSAPRGSSPAPRRTGPSAPQRTPSPAPRTSPAPPPRPAPKPAARPRPDAAARARAEAAARRRAPLPEPVPARQITGRSLLVVAALLIALVLVAPTLRVFLNQQLEISAAQEDIAQGRAQQAQYEERLRRWDDPAYVAQQARERLDLVMPGETLYTVTGLPDEGAAPPDPETPAPEAVNTRLPWVEGLWDSVIRSGTE